MASLKDVKSKYESRIAGLNTQALYESVAITKNGKEIPIEVNSALMEYRGKPATQSIVRVITERKIAEAALKESEERFKQLFNNMGSGVSIYEPVNEGKDFKLIAINNAGEKLRGITSEKSLGTRTILLYLTLLSFFSIVNILIFHKEDYCIMVFFLTWIASLFIA